MKAVNITFRVDEDIKTEFDKFCNNVGMNTTTSLNMFIRATLRTRELPFTVTDSDPKKQARAALLGAFKSAQAHSLNYGTSEMTLDEINAEIAEYRREVSAKK
jgi:DNA-damage-inducible protein J